MFNVFIGYPFKFGKPYEDALRAELSAPKYELMVASDRIESKPLWDKIVGMIKDSDLSVFDITGNRPNVCVELGYAIGAEESHIVAVDSNWLKENELLADLAG